ncbi:N-formylglutamate amidohydrolase [Roseibium album]|uniref:N-formylglutamate amidohydrolase n=1 Tax=Roseibium album TaxID=311410 RepID=UPI002492E910|nr:N-formylglutamate amidohydrolase [Roseibium album]
MILVEEGQSPLILCLPHSGTEVPKAVGNRFNATGRLQADLGWRLERVFGLRSDLDLTVVRSSISRYVIDLDKDPGTQLHAAADPAVALCPATTLDGKRIYQDGEEPGPTEIEQRVLLFHAPFHKALRHQIDRLMRIHRNVIVLDCQSMRSQIKGFVDKELPIASIGSSGGTSCDTDLRNLLVGSFSGVKGYTAAVDEQTSGGFIVQSYGRPERGLHCLTLLLAQRAYLRHESPPFEPDKARVARLQTVLADGLSRILDWAGIQARAQVDAPDPHPLTVSATMESVVQAQGPAADFVDEADDEETRPTSFNSPQPENEAQESDLGEPSTSPELSLADDSASSRDGQFPLLVAE